MAYTDTQTVTSLDRHTNKQTNKQTKFTEREIGGQMGLNNI